MVNGEWCDLCVNCNGKCRMMWMSCVYGLWCNGVSGHVAMFQALHDYVFVKAKGLSTVKPV